MNDFIKELAQYFNANCNGYDFSLEQATSMHKIAAKHNAAAELVYLMQFNYEDCTTVETLQSSFQATLM